MKVEWVPATQLLRLQRRSVEIEPDTTYQEIGVRSFGRGLFLKDPVSGVEIGSKRVFEIHEGDFVVSNVFAWEGAVGIAGAEHHGRIGSHRFMTWIPVSDVKVDYLAEFFRSSRGVEALAAASPGSAGRNRTLSIANFEAIRVPLPGAEDQERVAAHLKRVEEASRPSQSAREVLVLARAEAFRRLEQGTSTPLREILSVRSPTTVEPTSRYGIAGVFGFGRGMLHREEIWGSETRYRNLTQIHEGDVVYSKLKAFEGALAVVHSQDAGRFVSPEFPVFEVRGPVTSRFLEHMLLSTPFLDRLAGLSTGIGARRERVNPEHFLGLQVPVPAPHEQELTSRLLDRYVEIVALDSRRSRIAAALLPAARNEIFNAMR